MSSVPRPWMTAGALLVVVTTLAGLSASGQLAQAQQVQAPITPSMMPSLRTMAQACVCSSTEDANKMVIANCQCGSLQCVYAYGNQGSGSTYKQPALVCIK